MIDFEKRLKSLKNRRQGIEKIAALSSNRLNEATLDSLPHPEAEIYENLRESPGVKYAVGAMASVGQKYTETSINEGNRVANVVTSGLHGIESVTTRMQGSVALDIHIKGFSDVDMLIICNNPVSTQKPHLYPKMYSTSDDGRDVPQVINDIGNRSESLLRSRFYAATVKRGKKSIAIEGGSLTRKVDIVPSIWYDSYNYQKSGADHERGVQILDTSNYKLLSNFPFLHIKRINDKDGQFNGNLKSLIRLIKNMVADMPEQKNKQASKLTSFDVAAICYHMNNDLYAQPYLRLGLVEKLRNHLDYISINQSYKASLSVPDDTRRIFDSSEKDIALEIIRKEITDLAISIGLEINPRNWFYMPSDLLSKSVYL